MRAEAFVTEYFYNNAQRGFCETRIINQTLSLRFLGNTPMVFKPGMLFEGAVAVRYHDQVALPDEVLRDSQLEIKVLTFFFINIVFGSNFLHYFYNARGTNIFLSFSSSVSAFFLQNILRPIGLLQF